MKASSGKKSNKKTSMKKDTKPLSNTSPNTPKPEVKKAKKAK